MKLIKTIALAVCFSLSAHAADKQENETIEEIRENITGLDRLLKEKETCSEDVRVFAMSAKIHCLTKLHEKLLSVQERREILKEIDAHLNDHPTRYGFALRAQFAVKNNDACAVFADIVAASKTPESGNPCFENEAKAMISQLVTEGGLKQELLTQFNSLPNTKERHDVELFLQSCGLQFVRNPLGEEKAREHAELALQDLIAALQIMANEKSSNGIEDTYCLNGIKDLAKDVGVQQAISRLRKNGQITEKTEALFNKYGFFQEP